jgi:K+-sensing histidine kinase KdpD
MAALGAEFERGAGAVVLTEEALAPERRQFLVNALAAQPIWSDLPVILLASRGPWELRSDSLMHQLGNVLVLERPISAQTLLGVVQLALRTRRRQYQARLVAEAGELLATALADDAALTALTDLLVPRLADCCLLYALDSGTARVAAMTLAAEARPAEARLRAAIPPGQEAPTAAGARELAETHLRLVGATAHLVVPLQTYRRQLGVLSLGMLTSGRTFAPDDRQVVREVADRVALALEQARLYRVEQAARAEAEAALLAHSALLALISHDLNNPLTTIIGQSQLLERQLAGGAPPPERLLRGLTSIGRAAHQMQAQIAELLETARLQAGQPLDLRYEPTDLVALAQTVAASVQQTTERHQLRVQTQLPALTLMIDAVRINRVLANLLSNAVKYSPAGGIITVRLEVADTDAEAWAVVEVQDQGMGIPAADLPHIFERFRRASNVMPAIHGTGLGLASVRQIVEQHGGQVAAANALSGGAILTVRLPLRTTVP